MIRPVIKWSGSKRLHAGAISSHFPKSFKRYYEPFVGGGSVLYTVAKPDSEAVAGDTCKPLIDLWTAIRDRPDELSKSYAEMWEQFQKREREYYYSVRDSFNLDKDPESFLFLDRTCYNGLIRFNSSGDFNSPVHFGRPGINPSMLDQIIHDWSNRISEVEFKCCDFEETLETASDGDLAYLDPPYLHTKGMYSGGLSFDRLVNELDSLNSCGVRWVLSYDGIQGDTDLTVPIPDSLYERHLYMGAEISTYKKLQRKRVEVKNSLYLNF